MQMRKHEFRHSILLLFVLMCAVRPAPVQAQTEFGSFEGVVRAEWLRDGRNMKLLEPFAYVDPTGLRWDAPTVAVTDGASVPQALWSLYAPFTGAYRDAAVLHDHYCQTRSRRWQSTHYMCYQAMRANGVSERNAKTMWAGVYAFGPRWGRGSDRSSVAKQNPTTAEQKTVMKDLASWIDRENPNPQEIERRIVLGRIPKQ
jgi:uncharacterized protein DUF1353